MTPRQKLKEWKNINSLINHKDMNIEIKKTNEGENSVYLYFLDGVNYPQKGAKTEEQARYFAVQKIKELKSK